MGPETHGCQLLFLQGVHGDANPERAPPTPPPRSPTPASKNRSQLNWVSKSFLLKSGGKTLFNALEAKEVVPWPLVSGHNEASFPSVRPFKNLPGDSDLPKNFQDSADTQPGHSNHLSSALPTLTPFKGGEQSSLSPCPLTLLTLSHLCPGPARWPEWTPKPQPVVTSCSKLLFSF